MKWKLTKQFQKSLKSDNVRVRNGFWEALKVFEKNPNDPILENKPLKRNLVGFWKIDITDTNKYAAIYFLEEEGDEKIANFVQIGKKTILYDEKNAV